MDQEDDGEVKLNEALKEILRQPIPERIYLNSISSKRDQFFEFKNPTCEENFKKSLKIHK